MAIGSRTVDGFETLTLGEPARLEAAFAPAAGMVGCSLLHRGEQLLGLRAGLAARRFALDGREAVIDPDTAPVRLDEGGLPIHGLLSGAPGWTVDAHEPSVDGGRLAASFAFDDPVLLAGFPFPHRLRVEAVLEGETLTIVTIVEASAGSPVPVSFGWHPYLRLPDVPRSGWRVEVPVSERLVLDDRKLPTGAREPAEPFSGALGERTFDDAYLAPAGAAPFVLEGGGRRIELALGEGYPFAQVFAPPDDAVIAFEPMTAPTNALVDGSALRVVEPGGSLAAAFSIGIMWGP